MTRKFTDVATLCGSYQAQVYGRRERYRHILRAVCRRSGGYERFAREHRRYHCAERDNLLLGRVFYRLTEMYPKGKLYIVRNGKIVAAHSINKQSVGAVMTVCGQ